MERKFTVPGPPKGKQRPRICTFNGQRIAYTPKQTVEYEKLIRASYTAVSKSKFERNLPLEISILALFPIPKYVNRKTKDLMLNGRLFPTKKPDADNIVKIILDALNGVAYRDDVQICRVYFDKIDKYNFARSIDSNSCSINNFENWSCYNERVFK